MDYRNCPVDQFHDYKVLRSPYLTDSAIQVEVCKLCGLESTYKFHDDGRMKNERQYFLDHIRACAQQSDTDLAMDACWVYCNPKLVKKLLEEKAQAKKSADFQKEMKETYDWAVKRAVDRKGWKHTGSDGVERNSVGF